MHLSSVALRVVKSLRIKSLDNSGGRFDVGRGDSAAAGEITVNDAYVRPAVDAISTAGRTGQVSDGKVFILDLEECLRIRTREEGGNAIG